MARVNKRTDRVRPRESGRAGDENFHGHIVGIGPLDGMSRWLRVLVNASEMLAYATFDDRFLMFVSNYTGRGFDTRWRV